jgi:hypothetical protein
MKKLLLATTMLFAFVIGAFAQEGAVPKGIPHLDHVFVIMMENHGYFQIINNANAPYINKYAKTANLATQYFRRSASQPDKLSRDSGRFKFRRS